MRDPIGGPENPATRSKSRAITRLERTITKRWLGRSLLRLAHLGTVPVLVMAVLLGMALGTMLVTVFVPNSIVLGAAIVVLCGLLPALVVRPLMRRLDDVAGRQQIEVMMAKVKLEEVKELRSESEALRNAEQGLTIVEGAADGPDGHLSLADSVRGGLTVNDDPGDP